jgi:hypothetical protein
LTTHVKDLMVGMLERRELQAQLFHISLSRRLAFDFESI